MVLPLRSILLLSPTLVLALASCAAPKVDAVVDTPTNAAPTAPPSAPAAVTTPVEEMPSKLPQDGIRLPDMLGLPSDNDLRSTRTSDTASPANSGAVIARPPVETPAEP